MSDEYNWTQILYPEKIYRHGELVTKSWNTAKPIRVTGHGDAMIPCRDGDFCTIEKKDLPDAIRQLQEIADRFKSISTTLPDDFDSEETPTE